MTEQTGEQYTNSPELGFVLGEISFRTTFDFLVEMRDHPETTRLETGLGLLEDFLTETGIYSPYWHAYVEGVEATSAAYRAQEVPTEIKKQYRQLSDELYALHLQSAREAVDDINQLLVAYPHIVVKGDDPSVALEAVAVKSIAQEDKAYNHATCTRELRRMVWSDSSETTLRDEEGISAKVNLRALPLEYQQSFREYLDKYEINGETEV